MNLSCMCCRSMPPPFLGKGSRLLWGKLLRMYSWIILRPHIQMLTMIAILEDDVFPTSSLVHCCRSPSRTSSTLIGLGLYC